MLKPWSEESRTISDGIAVALSRHSGVMATQLMALMGDLVSGQMGARQFSQSRSKAPRVGIWEATKTTGSHPRFVRTGESATQWALWADVPRIEAKGTRKRVVLLGESVARGMFYDPVMNVAKALELILNQSGVLDFGVEVVDLARINLTLTELYSLANEAVVLEPDAVVVFAGNNWGSNSPGPRTRLDNWHKAALVRHQGIGALKSACEVELARQVSTIYADIVSMYREKKVPVMVVIPEYNLVDFRDVDTGPPLLRSERNFQWHSFRGDAIQAFQAGRFEIAENLAKQIVDLDEGTSPVGLSLVADCLRKTGREMEARRFLERARDASIWDPTPRTPRTYTVVQETLRTEGKKNEVAIVDLPKIFEACCSSRLPGRQWFIDYCHLSLTGIRVAAIEAARRLLPLLGVSRNVEGRLEKVPLAIPPAIESETHFAAAIHNAHWGQGEEIVSYHCQKAIDLCPQISAAMRRYIELSIVPAPIWMSRATEELAEWGSVGLVRYVLSKTTLQPKLLDEILVRSIAKAVDHEILDWAGELRISARSRSRPIDLLTPYHALDSVIQREAYSLVHATTVNWPNFYRAYERVSRFTIVETGPANLHLRLTCRVPAIGREPVSLSVRVNRDFCVAIKATSDWKNYEFVIPANLTRRGVNEISIEWPGVPQVCDNSLNKVADDLEAGKQPEYYFVFGEIHSFSILDQTERGQMLPTLRSVSVQ